MTSLRQLGIIARKEFLSAFRTKLFLILSSMLWGTLIMATYVGYENYKRTVRQRQQADSRFRHEWEEQHANPHSAAHYGTYLFKPNSALSLYDPGLTTYLGVSYRVEAHVQHEVNQTEVEVSDSPFRMGELSVAQVFQVLMPLLILLLSFNAITGEREGNTLRLLLTQGIAPQNLIWGKIIGTYAIVLSIVLPALFLLALPLLGESDRWANLLRYGLFSGAYLLYFFVFTGIGVLLSGWHKTSQAALVSSIGLWLILTILIPRLIPRIVDGRFPLPSRFELDRQINQGFAKGLEQDGTSSERYNHYLATTLKKYGVDTVTQLPVNFDGLAMQFSEDYNTKVYDQYAGQVEALIRQQERELAWSSLIDPCMAVQQLSTGLAGTDYWHHRAFHQQAKTYRDAFVRTLNVDLAQSGSEYLSYSYEVGPDFFKKMGDFQYNPPAPGQAVRWQWITWLALLVWGIGLLILLPLSAHRLL